MKYYVVTKSPAFVHDYDSQIAVFQNEEKCKSYVEIHNKPYNNAMEQSSICRKCHTFGDCRDSFSMKDICKQSSIKEDRNGLYCENEVDDYGGGTFYYSYEAVDYFE